MIPKFYVNHGRRCAQTVMRSFTPAISWKELDRLTGRKKEEITTPLQIAYGFYTLKIPFIYPVKDLFFGDFDKIREESREFGEENFLGIDFEFLEKARKELIKNRMYCRYPNLNFRKILNFLKEGMHPIVLINYDKFVEREDKKRGHYLIIRGVDKKDFTVADCGPSNANPNRKIPIKRLENSLMQTPIDFGVILV